jgi:phosphate butyryltransferase
MEYKNFDQLIAKVKKFQTIKKVAVVAAQDEHTLIAVLKAKNDKLIDPILIGNRDKIKEILSSLGEHVGEDSILDAKDDKEAALSAVKLVNECKADFIMKGKIQTADLMREVVSEKNGLRTGRVMSHIALFEVPSYHKLIAVTDGGLMLQPSLEEKKEIIENVVDSLISMGYECPKVAVLAAVETVNPKMQESVDASKLKEMNQKGEIINCIVEGPISYDLAMSREAAKAKGYSSTVTEDVDIFIVPNIVSGNILGKSLVYSAGARMAGFIAGAKVPVVLTSRGASSEEKYLSLVLSAASAK